MGKPNENFNTNDSAIKIDNDLIQRVVDVTKEKVSIFWYRLYHILVIIDERWKIKAN